MHVKRLIKEYNYPKLNLWKLSPKRAKNVSLRENFGSNIILNQLAVGGKWT